MPCHAPRAVLAMLGLAVAAACGKPMDPSGKEDTSFTRASMGLPTEPSADPNRPLASDLAVLPVSMVVTFNRLQTPDKLQDFLNRKPGQFSHIDLDKDGTPDPLTVVSRDSGNNRGFEIRVHPTTGEFVVATMLFDKEWEFMGHYSGALDGAASTLGHPLPVAGAPAALPTITPTPVASAPSAPANPPSTGSPATAPAPAVAAVQAVPAGG